MRAVIVGAGIGGLVAGLRLGFAGWEVQVLEQDAALRGGETGLQIAPNGMRILARLGLDAALRPHIFYPQSLDFRDGRSGAVLAQIPIGAIAASRYGGDYIQIQRAVLIEALCNHPNQNAVRFNARVIGVENGANGITAILQDGTKVSGDILIGADGVKSAVRDLVLGEDAGFLRENSKVAFRAVVPTKSLGANAPPESGCIWLGRGQHAVTTRIGAGALVNFVGITDAGLSPQEAFADWHPSLKAVIKTANPTTAWPLYDAKPLPRWHAGRAVLLGDACHPMLPSFAQGACQAIEDAWVLTEALQTEADFETAFTQYYMARISRTRRVQKASRHNMALFHKAPPLGMFGNWPLRAVGRTLPSLLYRRQDWLWNYDVRNP